MEKTTTEPAPTRDLIGSLILLGRHADAAMCDALQQTGCDDLTPRQRHVMACIRSESARRRAAPSQTAIEAVSGVDRSTLSDIVRRLIKAGYVSRVRSRDDARAYQLRLTDQGATRLRATDRAVKLAERAVLQQGSDARDLIDHVAGLRD